MTVRLPDQVSALFLDLDGTLVDTTYFHTVAWFLALDQLDAPRPMSTIHPLIGMGGDQLTIELLGHSSDELSALHDQLFAGYLPTVRDLPGARDLLAHGAASGTRVCIVTSSADDVVEALMAPLGGVDAVDDVVHSGMADRTKPHPDLFEVALERSGVPPSEALAVGDAVWDVSAARSAGVACLGLESGGTPRDALMEAGASDVYRDTHDLLHHWRGRTADPDSDGGPVGLEDGRSSEDQDD